MTSEPLGSLTHLEKALPAGNQTLAQGPAGAFYIQIIRSPNNKGEKRSKEARGEGEDQHKISES